MKKAQEVLALLGVKTWDDAVPVLRALLAGSPVAAVIVLYRPGLPGEYRVATVGVDDSPASLLALHNVLGMVQAGLFAGLTRRSGVIADGQESGVRQDDKGAEGSSGAVPD